MVYGGEGLRIFSEKFTYGGKKSVGEYWWNRLIVHYVKWTLFI